MGYYITLIESNFEVPETPEVLQALKDLNKRDDLKTGGRWQGGVKTQVWFAWMPADYDQTVTSVADVFDLLGFDYTFVDSDQEKLISLDFYDSKMGNEEHFLEAVAPFVKDGSYLVWRGEGGAMWRNIVQDGVLVTQSAHITFS